MKKKILIISFLIAVVSFPYSVCAGTVEDVEEYLSALDPNEITFEISEIEHDSGSKSLSIFSHLTPGSVNTAKILNEKSELISKMINEDWCEYSTIIDNNCGSEKIISTYFYKPDEGVYVSTSWQEPGLLYTNMQDGDITNYDPSLKENIPYEENIPLHMYDIAKDIVNSNFGTLCTYPDYYSEYQDDVHISYNDTTGEVSGVVTVDGEDHMFCTQFTYNNTGGANYTYDATYIFIEGVGCSGIYVPEK